MNNHGSTEEIANRSSWENVEGEVSEFQTLTQEIVNEQARGFIAPPTRQLEELTRLVQAMTTSRHTNFYPRTELGTTSGTPCVSPAISLLSKFLQSKYVIGFKKFGGIFVVHIFSGSFLTWSTFKKNDSD